MLHSEMVHFVQRARLTITHGVHHVLVCYCIYAVYVLTISDCPSANVGVIVAVLIAIFIYVIFILKFGRNSSGNVKIFMYFVQSLQIVVGPTSNYLPISSVFNFQIDSGSSGLCIAPLNFYSKSLVYILLPFLLAVALALTYVIQFIWRRARCNNRLGITKLMNKYRAWREARRAAAIKAAQGDSSDEEFDQVLPSPLAAKALSKETPEEYLARKMRELKDAYIHAFVFLVLFSYSTITLTTLQYINCRDVGPERLVATSPDISCTTSTYHAWSILYYVLLAGWVVGGPLLLCIFLYRTRFKLHTDLYHNRFGALYISYRPGAFWWEVVFTTRRTLLIFIYVILYDNPTARTFALAFVNVGIAAFHIGVRPFATTVGNVLESISLVSLSLIAIIEASTFANTAAHSTMQPFIGCMIFVPAGLILIIIIFRFAEPVVTRLRQRAAKRLAQALAPIFNRSDQDMTAVSNPAFMPKPAAPAPATVANPMYRQRSESPTTSTLRTNPLFGMRPAPPKQQIQLNPLRPLAAQHARLQSLTSVNSRSNLLSSNGLDNAASPTSPSPVQLRTELNLPRLPRNLASSQYNYDDL